MESVMSIVGNMGISITSSRRSVLGLPIGSLEFVLHFVSEKVKEYVSPVHILSVIALPHTQLAFSAFIHDSSNKWTYSSPTCPDIDHQFQPLEDTLEMKFLPVLTGRDPLNDLVHNLLSLCPRHGHLELLNPVPSLHLSLRHLQHRIYEMENNLNYNERRSLTPEYSVLDLQ